MSLAQGPPVLCCTTFKKLRVKPDFITEDIAPTLYKSFVFTRTSEDPSADFTPLSRELFFPVSCQFPWENDDLRCTRNICILGCTDLPCSYLHLSAVNHIMFVLPKNRASKSRDNVPLLRGETHDIYQYCVWWIRKISSLFAEIF